MSDETVELKRPRKPLEPVRRDDPRYDDAMCEYETLLSEWRRIDDIKYRNIEGVSHWIEKPSETYTVDEYNAMLSEYKARRAAYNERFDGCIETIEMVREKIRKLEAEDDERLSREDEEPEEELPEPPAELEDIPDEPLEQWKQRMLKYFEDLRAWQEKTSDITMKTLEKSKHDSDRLMMRLEEMGKFPQLDYELEMRLRHTYINPKTGESEYRPDDDVGEGLICVGSRDYTPKMED